MNLNYFKTDTEAIKHAINNIEDPYTYYPENKGNKYIGINSKGVKIWVIEFINNTMGWSISVYPNNLKINNHETN